MQGFLIGKNSKYTTTCLELVSKRRSWEVINPINAELIQKNDGAMVEGEYTRAYTI